MDIQNMYMYIHVQYTSMHVGVLYKYIHVYEVCTTVYVLLKLVLRYMYLFVTRMKKQYFVQCTMYM